MFHLVVTNAHAFPAPHDKVGALITDPAAIEAILADPAHRGVVKVFDHLTHAGVEKAAIAARAAAPAPDAPAA